MINISEILEDIRSYAPDADIQPVMTAYLLAARAHAGQTRKSGEPYLSHPLEVANILAGMRMDTHTIATALLHDALEDNPITKEEMAREIGTEITELVDGVTKIGKLRFRSAEELQAENFRKMMLAMSKDIRVILVKLADRTHNMRTLEHHRPAKQRVISNETLDIFVPIANRLGLTSIKTELEDLCFRYLHPEDYAQADAYLHRTQSNREQYIERVTGALQAIVDQSGIRAVVSGRAKHKYSIYKKVAKKGIDIADLYDLLAFRVIVQDVGSCYAVLGIMNNAFEPVPDRIKDYIARPKANGYQSLHTTVVGPEGRRVEIQIRTQEMHEIAERGIAAHWQYKEGRLALAAEDVVRLSRIRDLFDTAREAENATEFMETVKVELYTDEVFVFTPRGDIKTFRQGATALDFAFAIHSDVGMTCTGAKANGKLVALRYELQSGDTLEISTSPNQKPTRDWLKIAKTGRAVSKIRKFIREEERETGIRLGQEMLESELKKHGWSWKRLGKDGRLKEFLAEHDKDVETLFVEVARGALGLATVVRDLLPEGEEEQDGGFTAIFNRFTRPRSQSPVLISGEDGVLVNYAGCCGPLPGEVIVGFITRGRGITIHLAACEQLDGLDPERRIPVEWDPHADSKHSGEVHIHCQDRPGMLANITRVCEQSNVNISRAEARSTNQDSAICTLELSIRNVDELTRVIKNIEKLKGVVAVERVAG